MGLPCVFSQRDYNTTVVKKNLKNKDTHSTEELKRYLGALAETHNEHLKAIKDGLRFVNKEISYEEFMSSFQRVNKLEAKI